MHVFYANFLCHSSGARLIVACEQLNVQSMLLHHGNRFLALRLYGIVYHYAAGVFAVHRNIYGGAALGMLTIAYVLLLHMLAVARKHGFAVHAALYAAACNLLHAVGSICAVCSGNYRVGYGVRALRLKRSGKLDKFCFFKAVLAVRLGNNEVAACDGAGLVKRNGLHSAQHFHNVGSLEHNAV